MMVITTTFSYAAASSTPLLIQSMATNNTPIPSSKTKIKTVGSSKKAVKLLTRVEQLRLLTKAEKGGLLSAADNLGLSLSTIERLGLLSKAEQFGLLSAATDPATPSALLALSFAFLLIGPFSVYILPEDYPWQVAFQLLLALICVLGGSASFAASNFVSDLQNLK